MFLFLCICGRFCVRSLTAPRFWPFYECRIMVVVMSTGISMFYYGEQFIMHTQGGGVPLSYRIMEQFASLPVGIMAYYAIILKYAVNRWGQLWGQSPPQAAARPGAGSIWCCLIFPSLVEKLTQHPILSTFALALWYSTHIEVLYRTYITYISVI